MKSSGSYLALLSIFAASPSEALLIPSQNEVHLGIPAVRTFSSLPLSASAVDAELTDEKADADLNNLDFAPFDENCFPGRDENERFRCDPSVTFWRDFQNTGVQPSVQDNIRDMATIAQRFVSAERESSSYFVRHLGRTGYFVINAILGDAAYQFSKRNSNDKGNAPITSAVRGPLPMGMSGEVGSRLILEALLCYEQDYFDFVAKKVYKEPWDMASLSHRQSNPFNVLDQTSRFVREAVGTLSRRSRGKEEDREVRFFKSNKSTTPTTTDIGTPNKSKLYPEYYQTAFHYQGEGWMSTDSANVYETSTETLFLGRQDAMQRTSLPPIMKVAERFNDSGRPMRVLEVACGTGRFMTFVRDNLPLDAEYTALDLSPFYLEKAADNDSYWRTTRSSSASSKIAPATLVQAQAEDLPFADNSFDAVVCVYLFHELPRHVRAKAAAEMARVVSPGGTVVLTDSVQKGDRPILDQALGNFKNLNEPFYVDFLNDDLGAHFELEGLIPETKISSSNTKSLSFSKPGELAL